MKKPKSVSEYIAQAPKPFQSRLKAIRKAIKSTAPKSEEKISYGMPYYGYKGRLAYFALAKHHIGLYLTPPIITQHKAQLKQFATSKATVRFPHSKPLPLALIKKLVKARLKLNDDKKTN